MNHIVLSALMPVMALILLGLAVGRARWLDPEETREIMNRVFGLAAEIVARYNGRIEKFIGDALMAIFGVPVAHEDDPVRAVRAVLELHQAVAALSPRVQARTGTPIALHSGVNTGLVVTGEWQFDQATAGPLGDTINLAARLMGAAPSAAIWVGPATRSLVAHAFEFDDLGAHKRRLCSVSNASIGASAMPALPMCPRRWRRWPGRSTHCDGGVVTFLAITRSDA